MPPSTPRTPTSSSSCGSSSRTDHATRSAATAPCGPRTALVPGKSLPHKPVHDHTRAVPVTPGEVNLFVIEVNPLSMVFGSGTKMALEIKS